MTGASHSLVPLLAAITRAEEISRDVAARQALLAPARLGRALRHQSWQEAAHATVFRSALRCLPGRPACRAALEQALSAYAARLHADLDRGALAASLVGLQCVLEGFASVALQPPPGALAGAADTLVPLRAFILHQEQGHQRLGEVWAPRLQPDGAALARIAGGYGELAQQLLETGLAQLECLQDDAAFYREAIGCRLGATQQLLAGSAAAPASQPQEAARAVIP